MRRGFWLLATLALLATISGSAEAAPRPVADAVGVVWDSLQDRTLGYSRGTSIPNIVLPSTGNAIDTFLIFYDNDAVVWTAGEKAYAQSFFSHLGMGSTITATLAEYPETQVASPTNSPITLNYAGSFEDPGNEGNGCNTARITTIAANLTAGNLPTENAIYIVLPSTVGTWDCSSCPGFNSVTSLSGTYYAQVGACRSANNYVGFPGGPTSDPPFDAEMFVAHFESMGALASSAHRWQKASGVSSPGEVHEVCPNNPHLANSDVFFAPNGGLANFTWNDGVQRYAFLSGTWDYTQGATCWMDQRPNYFTSPCRKNADCPTFSGVCDFASGHCATPTCNDGVQNANELAPDQGGWCGSLTGGACQTASNCPPYESCISGVCARTHFCPPFGPVCSTDFYCDSGSVCEQRQPCNVLADCIQSLAHVTGTSTYTSCTPCVAVCQPGFTGWCN